MVQLATNLSATASVLTLDESLQFWGKAQPLEPGPPVHPLPYHALDVAACGAALMTSHPGIAAGLKQFFPGPWDNTCAWLQFLLAIHDVGKFAKSFQAKSPPCFPRDVFPGVSPESVNTSFDHGSAGHDFLASRWAAFCGEGDFHIWRPLLAAVAGHHGSPPNEMKPFNAFALKKGFGQPGLDHAERFVRSLFDLFRIRDFPAPLPAEEAVGRASYVLAGLAVLADWMGSNQNWFRYRTPELNLEAYWREAREKAASAVTASGVLPSISARCTTYESLIAPGVRPTPMQQWAESCDIPQGPGLFLVEDETGSGKTEAAIMLAHRLMACGKADGVYVALPTMATANAMFDRLSESYRHLFTEGTRPSVALSHSAREMHPGFRQATMLGGADEAAYGDEAGYDVTASSSCAAWIADDRRRMFLADVGAGTVDQALLGILPARHQSLRLIGLMHKILVLDEIHAYDAYMSREIEGLLEFQAAPGWFR